MAVLHSVDLPPRDVRLSNLQHVEGGLVQLDKDAIVDLTQTEQLEHLAGLRVNTVDTETHPHL